MTVACEGGLHKFCWKRIFPLWEGFFFATGNSVFCDVSGVSRDGRRCSLATFLRLLSFLVLRPLLALLPHPHHGKHGALLRVSSGPTDFALPSHATEAANAPSNSIEQRTAGTLSLPRQCVLQQVSGGSCYARATGLAGFFCSGY